MSRLPLRLMAVLLVFTTAGNNSLAMGGESFAAIGRPYPETFSSEAIPPADLVAFTQPAISPLTPDILKETAAQRPAEDYSEIVLDIGIGDGIVTQELARNTRRHVIAVDPGLDDYFFKVLQASLKLQHLENVRLERKPISGWDPSPYLGKMDRAYLNFPTLSIEEFQDAAEKVYAALKINSPFTILMGAPLETIADSYREQQLAPRIKILEALGYNVTQENVFLADLPVELQKSENVRVLLDTEGPPERVSTSFFLDRMLLITAVKSPPAEATQHGNTLSAKPARRRGGWSALAWIGAATYVLDQASKAVIRHFLEPASIMVGPSFGEQVAIFRAAHPQIWTLAHAIMIMRVEHRVPLRPMLGGVLFLVFLWAHHPFLLKYFGVGRAHRFFHLGFAVAVGATLSKITDLVHYGQVTDSIVAPFGVADLADLTIAGGMFLAAIGAVMPLIQMLRDWQRRKRATDQTKAEEGSA